MPIPDRLFRILRSCEDDENSRFPPTEVFNEGWMLRLLLDAFQTLGIQDHPLTFLNDAKWYSEARLGSPFKASSRLDALAEGFTNADGVIGHFDFRPSTKSGLRLSPDARQFVVVEAKMFSNLSAGTKNAPAYNQAARNVACMAAAIEQSSKTVGDFESLGFFVIAPDLIHRRTGYSNLESSLQPDAIRLAVDQRIAAYERTGRHEASALRCWETDFLVPLVSHLAGSGLNSVLSWEHCIEAVSANDPAVGGDLQEFYRRCLSFAPPPPV